MSSFLNSLSIVMIGGLILACGSSDSADGAAAGAGGQAGAAGQLTGGQGGSSGQAGSSQGGSGHGGAAGNPAGGQGGSAGNPAGGGGGVSGQAGSAGGGTPNAARACMGAATTTEQYQLPAPASIPAGVTFLSDWKALSIAGGFDGIQAMDSCRYQLDPSFHTWHGAAAVRVEVNPGDNPIPTSGERAEVLTMQDAQGNDLEESSASGLQFIATSYYFPSTWDGTFLHGDGDSWSAVMQFHPSGSDGYFAGIQAGRRDVGVPQILYYTSGPTLSELGEIVPGQWLDLVFHLDFATGELRIYRRNEGQTKFAEVLNMTDATMTSALTTYFKQGLYRGPDVNGRTDVLWIGPTSRGPSFQVVEQASFGTSDGF